LKLLNGLAYVTAEEMRQIDERAITEYSIDVLSLMENAGYATALLAKKVLGGDVVGKQVCCLAGKGNNGGDGFVAARHLHDWGADITLILASKREAMSGVPVKQFAPLEKMHLPIVDYRTELTGFTLLIDALLGYNSKGNPREPVDEIITSANASRVPILAVDLPSGLDPTTGNPYEPCIKANVTITFALPKTGFLNPSARRYLGDLYLADVSIPKEIYADYSQPSGLFHREQIFRIW
jgi:NAD(P)H-hydrate epimerase